MNKEVTLYDIKRNNGDWLILKAYLSEGKLKLEGHDFTMLSESMFGDEEYEYFYFFNQENTQKLSLVFNKKEDLLQCLLDFFNNEIKNQEFIKLCRDNNIAYEFSSWM